MKLLAVLLIVVHSSLAYKSCKAPEPYYNKFINSASAYPCRGNTYTVAGPRAQCVAVVMELCNAPLTGRWKKGTRVNTDKCGLIPKGTPIASFTGPNGKYNGDNGHAGILISCNNGNIVIADQWCAKKDKFNQRLLYKNCKSSNPVSNCADYFYTIEW